MFLKYLQIRNFRNLLSSRFEFSPGANTIIGENDSGKSNSMTALRILLDSGYFYDSKRLKETDFSEVLGDWKGHWIIISAFFDKITDDDKQDELCAELTPSEENVEFLRSYIRCAGNDFGTVTLFIRPIRSVRMELFRAANKESFDEIRKKISLSDYEFFYTSRSQADFTDPQVYKNLVGDFDQGFYTDPEAEDLQILGTKIDILSVWQHISVVFIDALRDAESELKKPRNPIRRVFDSVQGEITSASKQEIKDKIHALNNTISAIPQIENIGQDVSGKLHEIVGLVYSPEITVESKIKEDIESAIFGSCLTVPQVKDYAGWKSGMSYADLKDLYGWHISDLKIYDRPRPLSDFTRLRATKFGYEPVEIRRPPQSWFYVEDAECTS
jgi:putative ATP-dependent endonuclease of OLD family